MARTRLEIREKLRRSNRDGHPLATNRLHPQSRLGLDNLGKGRFGQKQISDFRPLESGKFKSVGVQAWRGAVSDLAGSSPKPCRWQIPTGARGNLPGVFAFDPATSGSAWRSAGAAVSGVGLDGAALIRPPGSAGAMLRCRKEIILRSSATSRGSPVVLCLPFQLLLPGQSRAFSRRRRTCRPGTAGRGPWSRRRHSRRRRWWPGAPVRHG